MTDQTQQKPDSAGKLEKRVFIGFAGTVTIGLCLAGWYVSSRVLLAGKATSVAYAAVQATAPSASNPVIAPTTEAAIPAAPAPVAVVPVALTHVGPAPVAPSPVAAAPAKPRVSVPVKWERVEPLSGQTYLQLAAMGPHATEGYLEELAKIGIQPLIAPGPSENISRFLVGPYATKPELKKAQTTLEGQGIQVLVRAY